MISYKHDYTIDEIYWTFALLYEFKNQVSLELFQLSHWDFKK